MKGIRLDLSVAGAPRFDFTNTVSNEYSTVQNTLVNVATEVGSDPQNPDRGTDLFRSMLQGGFIDQQEAQHVANFASLDVRRFYTTSNYGEAGELMTGFVMTVQPYDGKKIEIKATAKFGEDTIITNTIL